MHYRLNRYGDRQLNPSFHTVVLSRLRYDEQTKAWKWSVALSSPAHSSSLSWSAACIVSMLSL